MPIPFLLGAAAVLAAGVGLVGHSVAKENNEAAQSIISKAEQKYDSSMQLLDDKRKITAKNLASYGELKIKVCSGAIKYYVDITNKLSNKQILALNKTINYKSYDLVSDDLVSTENFLKIKASSKESTDIIATGITSLGSGALISIGTYNCVSILATASTGTTISSLSGAAATNATMAWLGGGSLAAGGLGMAGGAVMLGGIALGPAILISSIITGLKSQENIDNSKVYRKEVNLKIAEIEHVIDRLEAIQLRTAEGMRVLNKFNSSLESKLRDYNCVVEKYLRINEASFLQRLIDRIKAKFLPSYSAIYSLSEEDQEIVLITELLVNRIHEILSTPLLNENGDVTNHFDVMIEKERVDQVLEIAE